MLTREQVIEMAHDCKAWTLHDPEDPVQYAFTVEQLEAFANKLYEAGAVAEREEAAKVCEEYVGGNRLAAAIRSKGVV